MARLMLIRHGQTKLHRADRFWGSTDVELSEAGIRQVEQLRNRLSRVKIDDIYTSTLSRAAATAEIIASRHKARITRLAELDECNFGYTEGLTFHEIEHRYPELAEKLRLGRDVSFPGGESLEQLSCRVQAFLGKLEQHPADARIMVVAHGGPLRLMVCHLLGLGIEHWQQIGIDHASLSIIETYPQRNILSLLNDVSHLKS